MLTIRGVAALAAALCAFAAPVAAADTCETETLPQAIMALQKQVSTADEVVARLDLMDGLVAACPDHGWINVLGAELDMRVYDALVLGNNNTISQDAANYLLRAFARSDAYIAAPAEARQNRYGIETTSGRGELTHAVAARNRQSIIEALMQLARLGNLAPYIAGTPPPACDGWLGPDSQTIGYAIRAKADMIFLPFLDAAAQACQAADTRHARLPVAVKATVYSRLIQTQQVTDAEQVRQMLVAARDAREAYLQGREFDTFYSAFDSNRLNALLMGHDIEPAAGLLPREAWFTPEDIGSNAMAFSLAMALSGEWAALSAEAGEDAVKQTPRNSRFTTFFYTLLKEGREAGLEAETHAALRKALTDVQTNVVRSPAMKAEVRLPDWLYDYLMEAAAPPGGGN